MRRAVLAVVLVGCGPGGGGVGSSGTGTGSGSSGATTSTTGTTEAGTTDAGTTGSGTGGSTGTGAPVCGPEDFAPVTEPCADGAPVEQPDGGGPSGLALCADGSIHSYGTACCSTELVEPCEKAGGACAEDRECTQSPGGVCRGAGYDGYCICMFGHCRTDADCGTDEACLCSASELGPPTAIPRCYPAACRTDADCGDQRCGLSRDNCQVRGLFCHTPDDECHGPEDCQGQGDSCVYDPDAARWVCFGTPPCD